jgi:hypothetical protein
MKTLNLRSRTLLAGGLALALTAASAFAATPPADPTSKGTPMEDSSSPATQATTPYSSTSAQSNNSQTISMQSKFDSLDLNHDGYIDKQEAAADTKLSNQFAKLDVNKDGKLSMTEFNSAKGLAMTKQNKSDSSGKDPDRQ